MLVGNNYPPQNVLYNTEKDGKDLFVVVIEEN